MPELVTEIHSLQEALREIDRIREANMILEAQKKDLLKSETTVRDENRKLLSRVEILDQQLRKLSDRELENRVKANVNEEMVEKILEKMMDKMC